MSTRWGSTPRLTDWLTQSQNYVTTDSQSASLPWFQALIWGLRPDFIVRQLWVSWYGALSLTRGRVCLLYVLLALASAVFLGFGSLGTRGHILLSQIWDFPFRRLLRLVGSRWRYSIPPPHGYPMTDWLESESYVTTDGQSASLSWYKAPIRGLRPDFFSVRNTSESYVLDSVGHPLWREDGSVFYMCCWLLPAQSFSGPSPLGLATVFYCLRFETSLFCRLLRLAGSRWRYSTPPPHGLLTDLRSLSFYNPSARTTQKTLPLVGIACLQRRCIATEFIRLLLAYSLPRKCVYRAVV
jgi:hypothetical protein